MKKEIVFVLFAIVSLLTSNVGFASNGMTYFDSMRECDTLELTTKEHLACYEDSWHMAVQSCVVTQDSSACWMNGFEPFPIDEHTGEPITPDLIEIANTLGPPPQTGGGDQFMPWYEFVWGLGWCQAISVFSVTQAYTCAERLYNDALRECELWGGEHCWMDWSS